MMSFAGNNCIKTYSVQRLYNTLEQAYERFFSAINFIVRLLLAKEKHLSQLIMY